MRNSEDNHTLPTHERRRRVRVPLTWTVSLQPKCGSPVESRTKNISSEGFYCLVAEPFAAGDLVDCVIHVPVTDPSRAQRTLLLQCRARVVRVEEFASGVFGIACFIEQYHVASRERAVSV